MKARLRALIVEDSEDDAQLLVRELKRGGYEVDYTRVDTAEALRNALKLTGWDIILCDFSFPHFSGEEALRIAKEFGVEMPFIYVSGRMGEDAAVTAMKAGAHDYVMKNNLDRLLPSMERELREARERRQTQEAAQISELQLRAFINNSTAIIYLKDLTGRYIMVNRRFEELFHTTQESVRGKTDFEIFPREAAESLRANDRKVVDAGSAVELEESFEHRDGLHTYLVVKFPLRYPSGEIYAVGGISTDITDRKRVAQELASQKEAAEAASRAKDRFLAMLSHELRTPLTPVLACIELLEEDLGDLRPCQIEDITSTLTMMRQNIELERRLIDDLLDVTRIGAGKIELHREPVDAHQAIRDALEICQREAISRGVDVGLTLEAEKHFVQADPARLRQVIWNVLQNAVKYTAKGGTIGLSTSNRSDGDLVIKCRDTGIGIDPEFLKHIFDPFEQGRHNPAHTVGGLGLGLTISKALMEMHGGDLTAESPGLNKGAIFTIALSTVSEQPALHRGEETRLQANLQQGKGTRILLVEDNDDTRNVLCHLLTKHGFSVTTAADARTAFEAVDRDEFDILISDIGLPAVDGAELMRRLRERSKIKGIAISGFGTEQDIQHSKDAGFAMHLTKPLDFKELEIAIHVVCCDV